MGCVYGAPAERIQRVLQTGIAYLCWAIGMGASGVGEEAVADAADGEQVGGFGGVVFDITAQADDEVVDGAGVGVLVDAPDVFEDGGSRDDLAFAIGEIAE